MSGSTTSLREPLIDASDISNVMRTEPLPATRALRKAEGAASASSARAGARSPRSASEFLEFWRLHDRGEYAQASQLFDWDGGGEARGGTPPPAAPEAAAPLWSRSDAAEWELVELRKELERERLRFGAAAVEQQRLREELERERRSRVEAEAEATRLRLAAELNAVRRTVEAPSERRPQYRPRSPSPHPVPRAAPAAAATSRTAPPAWVRRKFDQLCGYVESMRRSTGTRRIWTEWLTKSVIAASIGIGTALIAANAIPIMATFLAIVRMAASIAWVAFSATVGFGGVAAKTLCSALWFLLAGAVTRLPGLVYAAASALATLLNLVTAAATTAAQWIERAPFGIGNGELLFSLFKLSASLGSLLTQLSFLRRLGLNAAMAFMTQIVLRELRSRGHLRWWRGSSLALSVGAAALSLIAECATHTSFVAIWAPEWAPVTAASVLAHASTWAVLHTHTLAADRLASPFLLAINLFVYAAGFLFDGFVFLPMGGGFVYIPASGREEMIARMLALNAFLARRVLVREAPRIAAYAYDELAFQARRVLGLAGRRRTRDSSANVAEEERLAVEVTENMGLMDQTACATRRELDPAGTCGMMASEGACLDGEPLEVYVFRHSSGDGECRFCRECLRGYLVTALEDAGSFPVQCPSVGCGETIPPWLAAELLTREQRRRFSRFYLKAAYGDPWRCPPQRCRAIHLCSAADARSDRGRFQCHDCRTELCARCKGTWHAGEDCGTYQARMAEAAHGTDAATRRLLRRTSKPCPGCRYPTTHYKYDGCHHITCVRCRHDWCYVCSGPHRRCGCPYQGSTSCNLTCGCPLRE